MTPQTSGAAVSALARRIENAECGSRELDVLAIAAAVPGLLAMESPFNAQWCLYCGTDRRGQPRVWEGRGSEREMELRRAYVHDRGPSRSLDAAMLLLPDGALWEVGHDGLGQDPTLFIARVKLQDGGWATNSGACETAALALTGAALRVIALGIGA